MKASDAKEITNLALEKKTVSYMTFVWNIIQTYAAEGKRTVTVHSPDLSIIDSCYRQLTVDGYWLNRRITTNGTGGPSLDTLTISW